MWDKALVVVFDATISFISPKVIEHTKHKRKTQTKQTLGEQVDLFLFN